MYLFNALSYLILTTWWGLVSIFLNLQMQRLSYPEGKSLLLDAHIIRIESGFPSSYFVFCFIPKHTLRAHSISQVWLRCRTVLTVEGGRWVHLDTTDFVGQVLLCLGRVSYRMFGNIPHLLYVSRTSASSVTVKHFSRLQWLPLEAKSPAETTSFIHPCHSWPWYQLLDWT
jgi:hypothetical protein